VSRTSAWIDEDDPYVSPMGAKGVGEIGIVGTAAAGANCTTRLARACANLPITLDKLRTKCRRRSTQIDDVVDGRRLGDDQPHRGSAYSGGSGRSRSRR
jgi:hypothetical protein